MYDYAGYEVKPLWRQYAKENPDDPPKWKFLNSDAEALSTAVADYRADVVHPCPAYFKRWVDGELLEPFDTSLITNFADLNPELVKSGQFTHRSPRQLAPQLEELICACRRETGWGPRLVAGATGVAHSTVWKVLKRAGISRQPRPATEPANRYEWPCPGDLLHMDTSRYARFLRPGHRVTGDRSQRSRNWMRPETRVGYDFAHAIVDDHSRLASSSTTTKRQRP